MATWCRFEHAGRASYGLIEGGEIRGIDAAPWESHAFTSVRVPLAGTKLLVPVIPPTFYAAGINYREHILKIAKRKGTDPVYPAKADIGYRANNALIADGETIVIPKDATDVVQYEGELVAVIGRTCRKVSEAEALDYVFGYTIGNDVSERTWQRDDRTFWRCKNADTFKPMGPWIVTGLNPDDVECTIRLSGRQVGHYRVKDAIFSLQHYISRMSQYLTLHPGDVVWMGTDGDPENMKHGDVVEIEIPGIGVLRNPVVREQ
jgi:2-keto-4-pentenoate hydratase/2-oxohepta-3-ene-1,7-dioic acid hydratase in catechol pathway